VEVLVALAILVLGIVGILQFFPPSLRASSEASLRGRAVLLAQAKAEEIRRDSDRNGLLIDAIAGLPAASDPIPFPEDEHLVYQFSSRSLRVPDGDPGDPEFAPGVARVVVSYNRDFRPSGDVLYELRFDGGVGIGPTPTPTPVPTPSPIPILGDLESPQLIAPVPNRVFTETPGQTITFQWTAVPNAEEYLLEVEGISGAAASGFPYMTVLTTITSFTVGPSADPEFVEGGYVWRVTARATQYNEGVSFTERFIVVP
jgi:type II secretory pathway pseudopilin PulG